MLAQMLRGDRVTLVFSPAGPERDTMVRRAVMPLFGRRAVDGPIHEAAAWTAPAPAAERRRTPRDSRRGAEVAIRFDGWGARPLSALRAQLAAELPGAPGDAPAPTLSAQLKAAARRHDVRLLLVFDGFEKHLDSAPEDSEEVRRFDTELAECLSQVSPPARVLFLVDDASQDRLHARYAQLLPQIDRGWLRVRPQSVAVPQPPQPTAPGEPIVLDDVVARPQIDLAAIAPGADDHDDEPEQIWWSATEADAHAAAQVAQAAPAAQAAPIARAAPAVALPAAPAPQRVRWPRHVAVALLVPALVVAVAWRWWPTQPAADAPAGATSQPASTTAATTPKTANAAPAARAEPAALAIAVPPDSGAARAMLAELSKIVAAPGVSAAAPGDAAPLAIWRADALPADREQAERKGMRVIAPLYREQIQVVVRADNGWRHLHQLQGLHINVGEAGGARERTAQALYRRLFGRPLGAWDVDRHDEASALQELLRPGSTLDAVFVVSDQRVLESLPSSQRARLRVLALDPQHGSNGGIGRLFQVAPDPAGWGLGVMVTSYLVATDESAASPAAWSSLACALARVHAALQAGAQAALQAGAQAALTAGAQSALQKSGSHLLRGVDMWQPIPGGWMPMLARLDATACSQASAAARR